MVEPTVAENTFLVYISRPTWTFAVKLHPTMEIITTGDPKWEDVMEEFQKSLNELKLQGAGK